MSSKIISFDTGHEEMIHDAQLDYYGKRLATASSDRTIKIFDINNETQNLIASWKGHEGPVWQVSWAHPKFGVLLASCSYDGKVCMWKEEKGNWTKFFEDASHESSVNSVAWAPHSYGICLASASADGTVAILTQKEKGFDRRVVKAHSGGVNAISWGPDLKTGALHAINNNNTNNNQLTQQQQQQLRLSKRFVTAGCDNKIKIWRYNESEGQWQEEKCFVNGDQSHGDWVRDVAWAPSLGLPSNTIASCSEDKTVIIWTEEKNGLWKKAKTLVFKNKVWRVSWSIMGNILAVSQGDNKVSLWKESLDGEWKNLSELKEEKDEKKE